ncbi:hypothetical protein R3P38DRAFT_2770622 [Favolaschia claudopus]|uniref:Uncharacterized protein n=1 Tax=Favolaschia claudopus TaxID=2862362 RepID=A0AAW0CEC6_9AGAR
MSLPLDFEIETSADQIQTMIDVLVHDHERRERLSLWGALAWQKFVQGILFATGCKEPKLVLVPVETYGTADSAQWMGVDPGMWLSPYFPVAPGSFNFAGQSFTEAYFEHERLSSYFVVLFSVQNPIPGTANNVVHPDNDLVSNLFGRLPIKWKGNVLVLRARTRNELEDATLGDIKYAKGVLKTTIGHDLIRRAFQRQF